MTTARDERYARDWDFKSADKLTGSDRDEFIAGLPPRSTVLFEGYETPIEKAVNTVKRTVRKRTGKK